MNTANMMATLKNETRTGGPFGHDEKLSLMGMVMAMIMGIALMTQAAQSAEKPAWGLVQAAAHAIAR